MNRFAAALEDVRRMVSGDNRDARRSCLSFQPCPESIDASESRAIRLSCGLTQAAFAACMGVSQKTVEAWEGGRSHPDGAARRLFGLVMANPHFFEETGIWRRS